MGLEHERHVDDTYADEADRALWRAPISLSRGKGFRPTPDRWEELGVEQSRPAEGHRDGLLEGDISAASCHAQSRSQLAVAPSCTTIALATTSAC